jgi:hypothetical protein
MTTKALTLAALLCLPALAANAAQVSLLPQKRSPVQSGVPFNAETFKSCLDDKTGELKEGKGTITGYAFNKIKPGTFRPAAGATVYLLPTNPYTDNMYMLGQYQSSAVTRDPQLVKYTRTTPADAQGRFAFEKIPPGDYTLEVALKGVQVGSRQLNNGTDKMAVLRIRLADGEHKNIQLTNRF